MQDEPCIIRWPRSQGPVRRSGFTLIEILIVVVIVGILAAIVVPQFSNAAMQARENTLKDELRYLRTQIIVYSAQHRDVSPGYPGGVRSASPSAADFVAQMTQYTSAACSTSDTGSATYAFGPYLSQMPANPLNRHDTIKVLANGAAVPAADDTTGWIYKPETQQILANTTGVDQDGVAYYDY